MDWNTIWNLGLGEYNWVVQAFLVVLICLIVNFFIRNMINRLHRRLEKTNNPWDNALIDALRRPLSLLIWIAGIALAGEVALQATGNTLFEAVRPLRDLGVVSVLALFLLRLARNAQAAYLIQTGEKEGAIDATTLDALAKLVRISIMITAALVALQTLGISIAGVLAFGGIGGIAVGFAAKDLLANFFGGMMIYLDRPFVVGDWIRSPDKEIEGTVEAIGWRLTRIRTFDARPLYVPNAVFSTISVQNPSRMTHRRIYEVIGIRYEDADKMSEVVATVKKMLTEHPEIDTSRTLIVNFNSFAPSSLDFFIYTFTKTTNWVRFHEIKEDVLLKVFAIIRELGAEIAFPTSTLHLPGGVALHSDPPLASGVEPPSLAVGRAGDPG
ncbi:MAG: mechanosensitive ion channel family protein [SAR324 cluster bacterium]|nr:mechanosensitive ion channel family protein [SAR324 cluster bacterium]